MKQKLVLITACFTIAVFNLLLAAPQTAHATEDFLVFTGGESEKKIEEQIGIYLQKVKGWTVNYQKAKSDPNDDILAIRFNIDGKTPPVVVKVDSLRWITEKSTGRVTGRKIKVSAYRRDSADGGMWKSPSKKAQMYDAINDWNVRKSYFAKAYVDRDGDLILEAFIPIYSDSAPVHIKNVEKVVDNVIRYWIDFHKELAKKGIF